MRKPFAAFLLAATSLALFAHPAASASPQNSSLFDNLRLLSEEVGDFIHKGSDCRLTNQSYQLATALRDVIDRTELSFEDKGALSQYAARRFPQSLEYCTDEQQALIHAQMNRIYQLLTKADSLTINVKAIVASAYQAQPHTEDESQGTQAERDAFALELADEVAFLIHSARVCGFSNEANSLNRMMRAFADSMWLTESVKQHVGIVISASTPEVFRDMHCTPQMRNEVASAIQQTAEFLSGGNND